MKDLKNRLHYPQVADIFQYLCKPIGLEWDHYHLLVLEFFNTLPYGGSDDTCAARCLVLESGQLYEVYADALQTEGERLA